MPVKKNFLQVDFSRGMVEHIEGDASYQDSDLKWQIPQSVSALYVENYDPTQIIGSLTKRSGMYLTKTTPWTDVAGLPDKVGDARWPSVYVQQGVIKYDADNFTGLALLDPSHSPLLDQYADKCTILGGMNVDYNRPVGQNILLTFLRDATESTDDPEKTRIVSYVTHLGNAQATTPYYHYNAHINGGDPDGTVDAPVPADYPGWDSYGTLSDATRFGGTVIFTTNLASELPPYHANTYTASFCEDMYPCYVWSYWDISRKRDDNEYWNVNPSSYERTFLTEALSPQTQSTQLGMFKILWPSMYATRESLVTFQPHRSDGAPFTGQVVAGGDWATRGAGHIETMFSTPATAIELAILESPSRNFTVDQTEDERLGLVSDAFGDYEYQYLNPEVNYVESLETLRNPATYYNKYDLYWDTYWRHGAEAKSFERINTIMTIKGREISVDVIGMQGSGVDNSTDYPGHMQSPFDGDRDSDLKTRAFWLYGVRLPHYVNNGTPRSWLKGEKIPLVVTAKIRGVEIKIGEYVHEVESAAEPVTYPSLFNIEAAGLREASSPAFGGGPAWDADYNRGHYLSWPGAPDTYFQDKVAKSIYDRIKDSEMKIDGRYVQWNYASWRRSNVPIDDYPADRGQYLENKEITPYMYEPFNRTGSGPYVTDATYVGGTVQNMYQPFNQADDDTLAPTHAGYRSKHTFGNHIWLTFRLRKDTIATLVDMGMEALSVYVAEGDPTRSQLRSINTFAFTKDVPPLLYGLPKTTRFDDLTKFRLVKTVLIDGKGKPFGDADDYDLWKSQYRGTSVDTNAWYENENCITAVGQNLDGTPTDNLTPDFMLWGYGTTNKTLSLNSSGEYWQGRGAGMVANIKGRTFLSGCVNRYGEEEQGIIRYSDVQSGVLSLDVFSDESYLKVGGLPHTALVEYREQLWAFSRSEVHRIQLPNVADPSSWEYLDKFSGQGTYCPKTTIKTPFGVAWCNDGGVWISDGRMPDNIAVAILGVYQTIATGTPWPYTKKVDLGHFPIENGQNPYLELAYDEFRNELVVITPYSVASKTNPDSYVTDTETPQDELRLIYNFGMRVWRVETYLYPEFGTMLSEFNERGVIGYDQLEPAP